LRQIVDEEVLKTKLENDKLRALNRKFEQNMADIVKKLESFTGNSTSEMNMSMNETSNNNEMTSTQNNLNSNRSNSVMNNNVNNHTPSLKSVIKFQNELKYKQILRDYEVKNLELQQKYDDLVK